jgi:Asp-tRNA(Asn)/Glu-tRNA(Gln) amidotransferase A subunit family amidase
MGLDFGSSGHDARDSDPPVRPVPWPRRKLLKAITALGLASPALARATAGEKVPELTVEMLQQSEWICGLEFSPEERDLMLEGVREALASYPRLREVELDNSVSPALRFDPAPGQAGAGPSKRERRKSKPPKPSRSERPEASADLAYGSVRELSHWLRTGQISSRELTELYQSRLQRFDPELECVITSTEESALEQADKADRRIAKRETRSPLVGIPWGAKDLLAVPNYRTTWGAAPYKDQRRPERATVVNRLDDAGAVLLAKLSVGALAWGDVWYGGKTKNPWNLEQGSSGSSAGSSAAVAAGLVGFAIGTETWGSIVSPCTRCGATGLRPTFGRVSRHGAMALSWSMDKIGPIARSAEDCAWIFQAINGPDGLDATVEDRPFEWPFRKNPRKLKVGFAAAAFEEDRTEGLEDEGEIADTREWQEFDKRTLRELEGVGFELVPIELPDSLPVGDLSLILTAEATTAFDELTRSGRDDLLVRQIANAWPNVFRQGQLIPAVEYLRANRIRTLLQRQMQELFSTIDIYVSPSFVGDNLLMTNLTGHPCVVLPNGFRTADGTPTSVTFQGGLFEEGKLLAFAQAYQEATAYHRRRPPLFGG